MRVLVQAKLCLGVPRTSVWPRDSVCARESGLSLSPCVGRDSDRRGGGGVRTTASWRPLSCPRPPFKVENFSNQSTCTPPRKHVLTVRTPRKRVRHTARIHPETSDRKRTVIRPKNTTGIRPTTLDRSRGTSAQNKSPSPESGPGFW